MANGQSLATPKQLAYIERLAAECRATIEKPLGEISMEEASEIIGQLHERVSANGHRGGMRGRNDTWSSGARIELAFKVCYQSWAKSGFSIFENRAHFMKNVIDTYQLLNEIVEKAEAA
jgi:hypothetical protein